MRPDRDAELGRNREVKLELDKWAKLPPENDAELGCPMVRLIRGPPVRLSWRDSEADLVPDRETELHPSSKAE